MVWKKSPLSWKEQGMSRSARAAAKAADRLPGGTHQDHDILRPAGAQGAVALRDGIALIQQLPDARRHEPGLGGDLLYRLVILPRLLVGRDEMELCLAIHPLRVIRRPEVEGLVLAVVHLPHLHRQNVGEDEVGALQNLPPGAEVAGQQDLPLLSVSRLLPGLEPVVFSQENGGIRQAKAVDALLHVPHSEDVLPVFGHRLEDGVLDLVGVLVLVHQDLPVSGRHLLPQLCGGTAGTHQQAQGQVLLVGEVGSVQPQLLLPVPLRKVLR